MSEEGLALENYMFHRLQILQEECAELIAAASHFIRTREGSDLELAEEAADVIVTLDAVRGMFSSQMIKAYQSKLGQGWLRYQKERQEWFHEDESN